MDRVRNLIQCDYVHRLGYIGRGAGVAILDTGAALHPDFADRIVVFRDFCNGKQNAYDDNGHGTHIAGIIAGSGRMGRGRYRGVAPGADLIILKVLDRTGNGSAKDVAAAMDWIVENRERYHICIANISVGMLPRSRSKEREQMLEGVDRLWDSGIFTVAAAGNGGPADNSVTIPGSSSTVLTVGSSDDGEIKVPKRGLYPGYSGVGPTECCVCKPEILAPGTEIVSCSSESKGYTVKSGTSMATGVVSGACALACERFQGISPAELKLRFFETQATDQDSSSWGVLDVRRLLSV